MRAQGSGGTAGTGFADAMSALCEGAVLLGVRGGGLSPAALVRRPGCAGQLHAPNRQLGPGSRGSPGGYGASPDSPVGCGGGGDGQRGRPGAGEGGGWPGSGGSSIPPAAAPSNAEG